MDWARMPLVGRPAYVSYSVFRLGRQTCSKAEVIQIGTFSPLSNTWLWAWANVTTLPEQREKSKKLRDLADVTGFALFDDTNTFEVDESLAWELAAVSVKHLGAKGCYRAPSSDGSNFGFLALMKIERVQ